MLCQKGLEVVLDAVLLQPGSTPRWWAESWRTSAMEMWRVSPSFERTCQTSSMPSCSAALGSGAATVSVQGGLIQFSGL